MILKYIKLNNIRSYTSQKIEFPGGSVMLSGDIGSGKSTILLAAEFALFGIMKGDVSGESLLRNGKKEGSVELCLEIGGKEVIINRVLKRARQGVKQDAGYIISGGVKKPGTSTELKAAILGLLGYPGDLLTKSKGLIYRYTVYTPQENMKKILFEDEEARLNTLRKVFDVDKYRRIRENAKIYINELKGNAREIEGFVSGFEEKKKQLDERMRGISEIEKRINEIAPLLSTAKESVEKCKKIMKELENDAEKLAKLKSGLAVCETELKSMVSQSQKNSRELAMLENAANALKKEIEGKEAADFKQQIKENENALKLMQETKLKISRKIAEMESKKRICSENKEKVSKLDSCPLCMQDVPNEHKKSIIERENKSVSELDKDIKTHAAQEKEADAKINLLMKELEELRKKEVAASALRVKIAELKEKENQAERMKAEQQEIKKSIGAANSRKMEISGEIAKFRDVEERHRKARETYEKEQKKLHELEIGRNTFETDRKGKLELAKLLREEIAKQEQKKSELQRIKNTQNWLETHFVSIMALMEKQVMAQVYHSFNELFQNWFSSLMEDESITARLDDSFTPVVQQNGYDTSIAFLSGGEKTSCALAYRLALNKVINDLVTAIQTRDIIILDEPTDGFSTEQLDRVREVIDQLDMKQVIIVSHEQKIEGFVDNVIRIQKNEHISAVV